MAELFKGLERIEEARERLTGASFMEGVFVGRPDFALLLPPPEPPDERTAGEAFCRKVEAFLKSHVDPEEISAFALTEPITGSDAANIQTEALLDRSGAHFLVNGEKLWCTNGPIARYITLIARVPARKVLQDGKPAWAPSREGESRQDKVHTAFILPMETPGVTVLERCQFEGCRGIENAYIRLKDVRIPAENVIGEIGKGLKYALTILNIGRAISIPAICL